MRAALALLALLVAGCVAPSQADERIYGAVTVAFGPSLDGVWAWRADQLPELRAELDALSAVGPVFHEASEGEADVVVRAASLDGACGRYSTGLRYVEVDAACAAGYGSLRAAVGHELLHFVTWQRWHWVGHVCERPDDGDRCHPTIAGRAVLNPGLTPMDPGPGFNEVYSPSFVDGVPTEADLALVRALAAP